MSTEQKVHGSFDRGRLETLQALAAKHGYTDTADELSAVLSGQECACGHTRHWHGQEIGAEGGSGACERCGDCEKFTAAPQQPPVSRGEAERLEEIAHRISESTDPRDQQHAAFLRSLAKGREEQGGELWKKLLGKESRQAGARVLDRAYDRHDETLEQVATEVIAAAWNALPAPISDVVEERAGAPYSQCSECGKQDDPRRSTCLNCSGQTFVVDPAQTVEQLIAELQESGIHVSFGSLSQPPVDREEALREALEKVECFEKALRFYADHRNYEDGDNEEIPGHGEADVNDDVIWTADGGYVARAALGLQETDKYNEFAEKRIPAEIRDAIYAALDPNPSPASGGGAETVGQRIRRYRLSAGLTIGHLAREAKIEPGALELAEERADDEVPDYVVAQVAVALGLRTGSLLTATTKKPEAPDLECDAIDDFGQGRPYYRCHLSAGHEGDHKSLRPDGVAKHIWPNQGPEQPNCGGSGYIRGEDPPPPGFSTPVPISLNCDGCNHPECPNRDQAGEGGER